MSQLREFYNKCATDINGRYLEEILAYTDDEFESTHDCIQWLFPLKEPSNFNPDAPFLTEEDILVWNSNPELQKNLLESFDRFLSFCGIQREEMEFRFAPDESCDNRVWKRFNHNMLRITRVLKSLSLLGLREYSLKFYELLKSIYESNRYKNIPESTFEFWTEAVKD